VDPLCAKRVTSQDVADRAGVSRTTVSLVLNNHKNIQISQSTRERVIQVANELGYVPNAAAQALASKRSRIIGLILTRSLHHISSDAFLTQILDGILDVIHQHDMRLVVDIIEPEHQKELYLDMVRAKRIDGILLSGPRFDDEALKALQDFNFPTVLIGQLPDSQLCSIDVDNRLSAKVAVDHLIKLGHSHIACITNAAPNYTASLDRLNGYKDALQEAGISFREELVRFGDFQVESGYEQMKDLLSSGNSFSAAFIASDMVALGAKAAIRESGLEIPEDIAIVGFDDLPFSQFTDPPLTTVHIPAVELGKQACRMLIGLFESPVVECKQKLLDTHLVVRKSCGAGRV
jgi:LacI family transcriptional regulator